MSESREDHINAARKALWNHVRLLKDGVLPYEVDEIAEEVVDALFPPEPEKPKWRRDFPFNRAHGSLYDRGSADSYYRRRRDPHYGGVSVVTGSRTPVTDLAAIAEYSAGYDDNEREGNHDD
jgi:hypothetical protein